MSYASFVARRTVFAAFLVVTVTFGVIASTPNANLGGQIAAAQRSGASQAEIQEMKENYWEHRSGGADVFSRYVDHVVGIATLNWGTSYELNKPVIDVLANRLPYTLAYAIPGVVVSFVVGSLVGLFDAFRRDGVVDRTTRVGAYLLMGLPAFWIVHFVNQAFPSLMPWLSPTRVVVSSSPRISPIWSFDHPVRYVLPAFVLSLGLVAGLLQHSRAESLEYERAEFVKLLRAKGADRLQVARHVLRNAAIPILTLSFVEVLAVLMLNIFIIEAVFRIPGLGIVTLFAIENRDVPLVLGSTMVLVFVGIVGNLAQDVLYGYLDPTINSE